MSEKKFKESDVVINTQNGKEYYITQIEKVYDADLKHSVPTGYAECRPNNLDDNLPDYNRSVSYTHLTLPTKLEV